MAYVDVTQHPDETVVQARQRRRKEIARGWRFPCECQRCEEEKLSATPGAEPEAEAEPEVQQNTVKFEEAVQRNLEGAIASS